ncbi:MAG: glutamate--tRNA ligase [Candidatus Micrarchaeota archaeon]
MNIRISLEEVIRKYALKNASDYGKANCGAVAGKVIAEFPDAKKDMKETMMLISRIVDEINEMSKNEIENELRNFVFVEKKIEEKKLTLPNAINGKVVTRFPPEPSGYLHIGHAKAAFLYFESARAYNGKMLLRFDDTNPEKEKIEYVNAIRDGLKWLGVSYASESYTSDYMPVIYQYAEKAILEGMIYICTCTQSEISKNREEQKECACRNLSKAETLARWKKMHRDYGAGKAVVRLKGNMKSLNTVMRDPSLFRIIEAEHYRQKKKYRVWPTYDFAAPILDSIEGITHMMRSKEYELRDELYREIVKILELRKPEIIEFSRLAIKGVPVSKRFITPLVINGKVSGWDDPRLPSLNGLARRGILPEAIKNFVLSFGLSKTESKPSLEKLLAENRKLLEPSAKHYFFVPDPIKLKIKNAMPKKIELKFYPNAHIGTESTGTRKINVSGFVYIPKADFEKISEGEIFRLKDLYTVKMISKANYETELVEDKIAEKKIQWVSDYVEAEILKPHNIMNEDKTFNEKSLEIIRGYAESNISCLKEGDVIQFERFGFCRLDKKNKRHIFVYSC